MYRIFPYLLMLLLFFSTLPFSTIHAQDDESLKDKAFGNKQLPRLTLRDLGGNPVDVTTFGKDGRITILNFWATWCSPCKKELNNIADIYFDWQDMYEVEIVAVSIDDSRNMSKVKSYVNGQAWEYTVLLDSNQDLKRALNFQTIPYTIMLDKEGKIAYTHSGYVEGDEYVLEEHIKELYNK